MREVAVEHDALRIRYEDLCTDPGILEQVKAYVDSPVTDIGAELGTFRPRSNVVHGDQITAKGVYRWRQVSDAALVADARRLGEMMDDYRQSWDYPEQ